RKARPNDGLRIEPGISRFPDVQLHICGLVLTDHPGMTASDLFAAVLRRLRDFTGGDIAPLHRRGIGKPRLRGLLHMRGQRRHAFISAWKSCASSASSLVLRVAVTVPLRLVRCSSAISPKNVPSESWTRWFGR